MASARTWATTFSALLLLLPCGCKPKTRKDAGRHIEVGRIVVSWVNVEDEVTLERDEVREKGLSKALAEKVEEHPGIVAGVAGRDPLELAVVSGGDIDEHVPETVDPGGTISAFTLRTTWRDGWRISSSILTDVDTDEIEDMDPVLDDLLEDLVAQLGLFDLTTDQLIAFVRKSECTSDDVCATAVRILGERGSTEAVPVMLEKLERVKGADPLLEDLVGALGRIGDESASGGLVDAFNRAHPSQQVAIIAALSRTGGEDARLFLEVVASGHESLVVREQAAVALASLKSQ
jgi:hypothetical protein